MEGYDIQPWLVWGIVSALLMMGAWMRVGAYLFYLGLAALLALVESLFEVRLRWQVVSFVAASCVFAFCYWCLLGKPGEGEKTSKK